MSSLSASPERATDRLSLSSLAVLTIEGQRSPLRVVAIEGREALSALFEFTLTLRWDEEGVVELPRIGDRASLELTFGTRSRTVRGIVRSLEQGDSSAGAAVFRAVIVPATYVLSLREDCRIFQGRRAPEIIEAVLEGAGFTARDYRLALHRSYAPREHSTQYRESDWSFLRRVLESEGIYAFFDHEDDREVLVFADAPLSHRRMAEPDVLPFRPMGGALQSDERVDRFFHVEELRARSVVVRGRDVRAPTSFIEGRAEMRGAAATIHDAPPALDAVGEADRLARLRFEQEAAASATARATSDCLGLRPGVVFGLRAHENAAMDRDWLVTSTEHRVTEPSAGEGSRYENRFTCIASDVPFRDRTGAPKPSVGIQTAVVVGPAGQEVHCDDLGRVKVQFRWDREGRNDDKSSSWLRVSQSWAGPGYGALFVPRVGHEVLVDFVDGDIDRPIIVGSVYHAANTPPASLPQD